MEVTNNTKEPQVTISDRTKYSQPLIQFQMASTTLVVRNKYKPFSTDRGGTLIIVGRRTNRLNHWLCENGLYRVNCSDSFHRKLLLSSIDMPCYQGYQPLIMETSIVK